MTNWFRANATTSDYHGYNNYEYHGNNNIPNLKSKKIMRWEGKRLRK